MDFHIVSITNFLFKDTEIRPSLIYILRQTKAYTEPIEKNNNTYYYPELNLIARPEIYIIARP